MKKYFTQDPVTHAWREDPSSGVVVRFNGGESFEALAQRTGVPLNMLLQAFTGSQPAPAAPAAAPSAPPAAETRKSKRAKRREAEAEDVAAAAGVVGATAASGADDSTDDGGEF